MGAWNGDEAHALYSSFSVGPENAAYQLYLGTFAGGSAGAVHKVFILFKVKFHLF